MAINRRNEQDDKAKKDGLGEQPKASSKEQTQSFSLEAKPDVSPIETLATQPLPKEEPSVSVKEKNKEKDVEKKTFFADKFSHLASMLTGKKENKLDAFVLREFLYKKGETALLDDLNKCLNFYYREKEEERWKSPDKVTIRNISEEVYNAGRWGVKPGKTEIVPVFEAERIMKDFPKKFEIVS